MELLNPSRPTFKLIKAAPNNPDQKLCSPSMTLKMVIVLNQMFKKVRTAAGWRIERRLKVPGHWNI